MAIGELVALVTGMVAVGGLLAGLYQYRIAQKWKRAEFAAKHLEQLRQDPELELFCKLLDWSVRLARVPERYRSLTPEPDFVHDWRILREALLPDEQAKREKARLGWQHMLYRDLMDGFFAYCEEIEHYIAIDLISVRDVRSLRYWLRQLAAPRFMPEAADRGLFLDYCARYDYQGVLRLIGRFGLRAESMVPAADRAGT